MVRKLQAIRNESSKKFKLIDFNFKPNNFMIRTDMKENVRNSSTFARSKTGDTFKSTRNLQSANLASIKKRMKSGTRINNFLQ